MIRLNYAPNATHGYSQHGAAITFAEWVDSSPLERNLLQFRRPPNGGFFFHAIAHCAYETQLKRIQDEQVRVMADMGLDIYGKPLQTATEPEPFHHRQDPYQSPRIVTKAFLKRFEADTRAWAKANPPPAAHAERSEAEQAGGGEASAHLVDIYKNRLYGTVTRKVSLKNETQARSVVKK